MNPPSVGKSRTPDFTPFIWLFPAILAIHMVAGAGQTNQGISPASKSGPSDTLMMVRDWEQQSGRLVGWLPMHQATLELEALDKSQDPHFTRDDALKLKWPKHLNADGDERAMKISPQPRDFEGQSWVPIKRDPNLVIIGHRYYIIRRIIFGESVPSLAVRKPEIANGFVSSQSAH